MNDAAECGLGSMMARNVTVMAAVVCLVISAPSGYSQEEAEKPPEKGTIIRTEAGGKLLINAKAVLYDFNERSAVFENEVTVTDSQTHLDADKLSVFLTAENSVRRVEAEGNVIIRELGTAKRATAGKAIYDIVEDTVVLTDSPQLEERDQGFYTKGAEKITYFRAKQQFKAEGENMQIEFGIPEEKAGRPGDLLRVRGERQEEKQDK